jgi:hypothetical protein
VRVVSDAAPRPDASNAERVRWEFELLNRHDVAPLKEHLWTAEPVGRFPDRTVCGPEEAGDYLEGQFAALTEWHMDVVAVAVRLPTTRPHPSRWRGSRGSRPPPDESGENGRVAVEKALGYVRVSRVGGRRGTPSCRPNSSVRASSESANARGSSWWRLSGRRGRVSALWNRCIERIARGEALGAHDNR